MYFIQPMTGVLDRGASMRAERLERLMSGHNGTHRALWFGGAVVLLHIVSAMLICYDDKETDDNEDAKRRKKEVKGRRGTAACVAAIAAAVLATVYVARVHKANGLWCKIKCGVAIFFVLMHLMYTLYLHRPGPGRFKHHEVMKMYAILNKEEDDPQKKDKMDTYYTKTRLIYFVHGLLSTVVFAAFLGVEDEWWK